jgi:hypothetical protein
MSLRSGAIRTDPRFRREFGAGCALRQRGGPVKKIAIIFALASMLALGSPGQNPEGPPPWANPVNPPDFKEPADDGGLRHVPNSAASWTLTQLLEFFFAPDWHPDDHSPMPEIVARGRKPDVPACGFCHRADGPGGPETQFSRIFPRLISCSRWPTSEAELENPPVPAAAVRFDGVPRKSRDGCGSGIDRGILFRSETEKNNHGD